MPKNSSWRRAVTDNKTPLRPGTKGRTPRYHPGWRRPDGTARHCVPEYQTKEGVSRSGPITGATRRRLLGNPVRRRGSQASSAFEEVSPALPVAPMPGFHRPRLAAGMAYCSCSQPVEDRKVKGAEQLRNQKTGRSGPSGNRTPLGLCILSQFGQETESGGPGGTRTLGLLNAIETRSQLRHGPTDGAEGIRTPGLFSAIEALSQLSYSPFCAYILPQSAQMSRLRVHL